MVPPVSVRCASIGVCLLLGTLPACAPITSHYFLVEQQIAAGRFPEADAVIERHQGGYGARNTVLYHLDRAMTLHLTGQYAESNSHLELAESRMEDLYTRSLTSESGAMLTNDNALPYEGEDFEKVMLNLIATLNYIFMGRLDEALVEARKIDHKLGLYNDRYEKKNVYKEDAFARYLSGILFETKGELNDAFIAYRKAHEAYQEYQKFYGTPSPPDLPGALLRVTEALGLSEEHKAYRKLFPHVTWISWKEMRESGEIIIVSFTGLAPIKEDFFVTAPVPDTKGQPYLLRVALPTFLDRPTDLSKLSVQLEPGNFATVASVVEDVTAIAKKNLQDRLGRITAKAVARAVSKYLAASAIREKARKSKDKGVNVLANLGTDLYSLISEQADKRSWRMLPGEIRLARLAVPMGRYSVTLAYHNRGGSVIEKKDFSDVVVRAGEKRFVSHRMVGPVLPARSR